MRSAVVFYAFVTLAGWVWLALRDRAPAALHEQAVGTGGPVVSATAGIAIGLGVSGVLAFAVRYQPSFARLERRLAAFLGPVADSDMLILALASGIGEELFFRLAMLDALGFWWTAALFGALHFAPGPLALWSVLAFGIGTLFCWMMAAGYGLLSVTLAHALINYLSLRRMSPQ